MGRDTQCAGCAVAELPSVGADEPVDIRATRGVELDRGLGRTNMRPVNRHLRRVVDVGDRHGDRRLLYPAPRIADLVAEGLGSVEVR